MKSSFNLLINSGSARWMVQRIGGVVIFLYALFILWNLFVNESMSYFEWKQIFEPKIVKFFSWVTVFSLISHAWIGIHCVISDYITVRLIGPKALVIRKILMSFLTVILVGYFLWSALILWGL